MSSSSLKLTLLTLTILLSPIFSDNSHCIRFLDPDTKKICSQCQDGYFIKQKSRTNTETDCIKCAPNCLTCSSAEVCLTCSSYRELTDATILFVKQKICVLKLPYMAAGFALLAIWGVLTSLLMRFCFCTKMSDIEKQFMVRGPVSNHYVNVGELMQRPQEFNAGSGPQNQHGYYLRAGAGGGVAGDGNGNENLENQGLLLKIKMSKIKVR